MNINIPDLPGGEYTTAELVALILVELKKLNRLIQDIKE
jgi:hypothetical protein